MSETDNDKQVARREFFAAGLKRLQEGAAHLAEAVISRQVKRRFLRPPGAVGELAFLSLCTKCDDCITACPEKALVRLPASAGAMAAGSPTIQPEKTPCVLCDDLPCIPACTTGALVPTPLEKVRIATIRLNRSDCLAWNGTSRCDYCFKWCPLSGKAIEPGEAGRPIFHDDACAGCGVCLNECPASPNPISLTPV